MSRRLALLTAAATLLVAPPASAQQVREVHTTVKGWTQAPGPRQYDRLPITKFGPANARTVLVLVPGTLGGRGDFTLSARELVRRVPGLQVWAVDRRSQHLEDTAVFRRALRGEVSTEQMFNYYLGWLADPTVTDHYRPPDLTKLGFVADWGLRVQLEDVRRVVQQARRGGRRVILGGHSLGASVAVAYAAWDFGGRPGHRDLHGLVLIDGGLRGSFREVRDEQTARTRLAAIREQPFLDLFGLGIPWITGVMAETAAILALREPTAPSRLQSFPLLPDSFRSPTQLTNRGALGFAFDESTSPKALSLIHVRAGNVGPNGDWQDGEVTPIRRLAETFGQEPANGVEWFYPARLNLDVDAASPLRTTPAGRLLGLRLRHAAEVRLPLYAIQTSLTGGAVLKGARRFISQSKVPRDRSVLVDASKTDSHLDPLTAAPSRSRYLKTVVPFLKRLVR